MQFQGMVNRLFERSKPEPQAPELPYLEEEGEIQDTDALVIQPPYSSKRQKHMGYIALVGASPGNLLADGLLYGQSTAPVPDSEIELRTVQLPVDTRGAMGVLYELEYADLILFTLGTKQRLSSEHIRWLSRMRELGVPMIVLIDNAETIQKKALPQLILAVQDRLHVPVVPIYRNDYQATREKLMKVVFRLSPRLAAMLSLHAPVLRPVLVEQLLTNAAFTSLDLDVNATKDEELSAIGEAQLRLARQIKAVYGRGARLSRQEYQNLLGMATAVTHYTNNLVNHLPTRNKERRTRVANAVSTLLVGYLTMIYHGETPPEVRTQILPHVWRLYRASGQITNTGA